MAQRNSPFWVFGCQDAASDKLTAWRLLLYSGSASTIAHMLGNAAQLVAALSAEEGPVGSGSNVARDVLAALLALETLAEGHGLIMEALIKQVDELVPWLDPASLHSQVVPLAMRVVASNSWQRHKRGAARIVLLCLRRLRFSSQRAEVSAWVVALASHPSYQMRLVFIDMLRQLLAAAPSTGCSRQFLKVRATTGMHRRRGGSGIERAKCHSNLAL